MLLAILLFRLSLEVLDSFDGLLGSHLGFLGGNFGFLWGSYGFLGDFLSLLNEFNWSRILLGLWMSNLKLIQGELRIAVIQPESSIGESGRLNASGGLYHVILFWFWFNIRDPLETLRCFIKIGIEQEFYIVNCYLMGKLVGGSRPVPKGGDLAQVLG